MKRAINAKAVDGGAGRVGVFIEVFILTRSVYTEISPGLFRNTATSRLL